MQPTLIFCKSLYTTLSQIVTCWYLEGRREGKNWVYIAFNHLGDIAARWKPGRNSFLFTNSSNGSFSCIRTIESPPQRRTLIQRPGQPACGDPAEIRTCKLALRSQASKPLAHDGSSMVIGFPQSLTNKHL